jgi:hypothetical protein
MDEANLPYAVKSFKPGRCFSRAPCTCGSRERAPTTMEDTDPISKVLNMAGCDTRGAMIGGI